MPSNTQWKIWDYFRVNSSPLGVDSPSGIYCFYCFDPFIEKILVTKIRMSFKNHGGEMSTAFAAEISADWIENEFCNLQLFGGDNSYIIHQSESLTKDGINFLKENDLTLDDRALVFIFNKKNDFYKFISEKAQHHTELEEPKFWEWDKMFHFLAQEMRVAIPYDVQEYILSNVEQSCGEFVTVLNLLRNLGLEEKAINLENVKKFITPSKIDQFEMAKIFSTKNKREFYKRLVELDVNYKDWQLFFSFMQGHLLKMAGPELLQKKSRLTQYDKQLINHSSSWSLAEINAETTYFGKLQILAKKNDPLLNEEIRLTYINCL